MSRGSRYLVFEIRMPQSGSYSKGGFWSSLFVYLGSKEFLQIDGRLRMQRTS